MKYTAAVSIALAGSAAAAGAADTVNQVLNDIGTSLKSFDTTVKGYNGGDASQIVEGASKIQAATSGGAQKIQAGSDLTLNDAVSITTTVQNLQVTLDSALSDLEAIASKIASSGGCSTVQQSLTSQASAAKSLQDAITSKAPAETKTIAQQLGGKIGASIANTQSKYKEACAGASSSSGSSAGHASSGHSGTATSGSASGAKPAKAASSSAVPKPATFTGAGSQLSSGSLLAFAAAILAL